MSVIIENSKIKSNPQNEKNTDIAVWLRFLKEQKIIQLFEEIPDPRQQSKIQSAEEKEGVINLLGCPGKQIPHSSTVDHALSMVDYEKLNEILLKQMDKLIKKKFFYNHQELLPGGSFCIAADGYWVHKYDHPHSADEKGNNCCPYCLSRTQHKGTPKEKTHWVHVFVTFVLITQAFTIPIYVYPLKAQQVNNEATEL